MHVFRRFSSLETGIKSKNKSVVHGSEPCIAACGITLIYNGVAFYGTQNRFLQPTQSPDNWAITPKFMKVYIEPQTIGHTMFICNAFICRLGSLKVSSCTWCMTSSYAMQIIDQHKRHLEIGVSEKMEKFHYYAAWLTTSPVDVYYVPTFDAFYI